METLWFGLNVTVIGFGLVFVALFVLMLIISALGPAFSGQKKKATEAPKVDVAPAAPTLMVAEEDDTEIAAVIAAAVAAATGGRYAVTAIRRAGTNQGYAWSSAGRQEQMGF